MDDYLWQRMDKIIRILNQIKEEGTSILWINSYPDQITEIADKTLCDPAGEKCHHIYKGEYEKEKNTELHDRKCEYSRKRSENIVLRTPMHCEVRDLSNFYISSTTLAAEAVKYLESMTYRTNFSRELRRTLLGRRFYNGSIRIGGKEYQAEQEYGAVRSGLGIIDGSKYQDHIFEELTILENIELPIYKKNARKTNVCKQQSLQSISDKKNMIFGFEEEEHPG